MSHAEEIWLVAGGEPGARRFGQLVQRLRKDTKWSVAELASRTDLSVGTIRAIEQGRRAPSKVTGTKLLDQLLPGALQPPERTTPDTGRMRLDYLFTDPQSGARVGLRFQARTAGDNRRWSADQPRAAESTAEARMREWQRTLREAMEPTLAELADPTSRATLPAHDASFGGIVRRLTVANTVRLERIATLLELWDRADSNEADQLERDLCARVNALLDSYVPLPDGIN